MKKHVSMRSKIFYRLLLMKKLRGQFLRCMETGVDKMGRERPSKFLLKGIDIQYQLFEGRRIIVLNSRKNSNNANIIFFHGGAYVLQSNTYHWDFITDFTRRTGACVYCIDYPLTPEFHSGKAYDFSMKFYKNLLNEVNCRKLYLMGDSAGGGLALSLLIGIKKMGVAMPQKAILLSPYLDIECSDPRQRDIDMIDPIISIEDIVEVGKVYAGELPLNDWRVSPINDTLDGLCNISIYTSDYDVIHTDALRLKEKLELIGIRPDFYFEPGMIHDWMLFRILPEALETRRKIAREL